MKLQLTITSQLLLKEDVEKAQKHWVKSTDDLRDNTMG